MSRLSLTTSSVLILSANMAADVNEDSSKRMVEPASRSQAQSRLMLMHVLCSLHLHLESTHSPIEFTRYRTFNTPASGNESTFGRCTKSETKPLRMQWVVGSAVEAHPSGGPRGEPRQEHSSFSCVLAWRPLPGCTTENKLAFGCGCLRAPVCVCDISEA
jgi:hypothetical protein